MAKRKEANKPAWKFVYLTFGLMVAALFLVEYAHLSPGWTGFLEGITVVFGFGLVALWLELSGSALLATPANSLKLKVYEYPPLAGFEIPPGEDELAQPGLASENIQPLLEVDHRRILELAEEREENLKCMLN